MKNSNFEFNDDNTSTYFSKFNYLNCPAEQKSADEFLNGVKPIYKSSYDTNLNGKTIDNIFFDKQNNIDFYCFTDGTFAIRAEVEMPTLSNSSTPLSKMFLCYVYASHIVNKSYDYKLDTYSSIPSVKITPFGRWLHEHTDADVVGFYEKVKHDCELLEEQRKVAEHEQDIKQYNYLKQKLGL